MSVKNLPSMQETWVLFLGQEDPLEKEMATHFNVLAWRIPMDRGAWQATVHGILNLHQFLITLKIHLESDICQLYSKEYCYFQSTF